jgi:hypothetical protein
MDAYPCPAGSERGSREKEILDSALSKIGSGEISSGLVLIDSLLKHSSQNSYALYLKGECFILSGRREALAIIDSLRKLNMDEYADVLDLKTYLFLGDSCFRGKLEEMKKKYPANFEVKLSEWLFRLDNGEHKWAREHLDEISGSVIFRFLPYQAFYLTVLSADYNQAKAVAETAMDKKLFRMGKTYRLQEALHSLPEAVCDIYEEELKYAECGPYFGIEMEDSSGVKLKVSLDTGTGGGFFSIHNRLLGEKISGRKPVCLKDGIQYRYMNSARDAFIKAGNFKEPSIENIPILYFEGSLTSSDGVFSPFAFKSLSISVDPVNRKVTLRSKAALKEYLSNLKNHHEEIKYVERFGWVFIPAKLQGREVLMMVETGSRDVNFNSLAVERYGIPVLKSTSMWNGREYPVKRPEVCIQIGSITYKPEDGFVEDFVMGNNMYGLAASGDIGPAFLKNYKFTIDPFEKRLILEKQ